MNSAWSGTTRTTSTAVDVRWVKPSPARLDGLPLYPAVLRPPSRAEEERLGRGREHCGPHRPSCSPLGSRNGKPEPVAADGNRSAGKSHVQGLVRPVDVVVVRNLWPDGDPGQGQRFGGGADFRAVLAALLTGYAGAYPAALHVEQDKPWNGEVLVCTQALGAWLVRQAQRGDELRHIPGAVFGGG
jgi:hypothetical protein